MRRLEQPTPLQGAGDAEDLPHAVRDALEELRARDSVNLRVSLDSALDRDPGFDSLARVELLVRIEHAFGVQLPDTVLESAETCRDLLAALQVTPCDDASEQTISYGQLWQQARAVAGGLQRRGLQPGQTVALMLPFGTAGI